MIPVDPLFADESFDTWLAVCDEALAAGELPEVAVPAFASPKLAQRIVCAVELLRLIERDRLAHAGRQENHLQQVDELELDYFEREAQGQPVSPADLCAGRPELMPLLQARLDALSSMRRFLLQEPEPQSGSTLESAERNRADPSERSALKKLTLPGYELLDTLGRGGMGVVYKARQLGFNRIVALKMVSGGHARADLLARFLAEAEIVARLRHPHIVQVFDFGTHDESPFFSMEYLEGGSLADRVRGEPQAPRWAAQLVQRLAEAMHMAHEAGVVHRDLKPANVMLDNAGSARITDFGLAKFSESDLTATDAVMGTPSYMAPEQAEGRTSTAGPPADIWALGATLYELLTGRPPFKGTSVAETLDQVRTREPAQVRLLQPGCPADLQTICQKCLQKSPDKRYRSSAALADDLRRFLAGEPIQARPVGALERAWRWCRRHRALAALYTVAAVAACLLLGMAVYFSAQMSFARIERELIKSRADAANVRADLAQTKASAAEQVANAERFVSLTNQARARIARPKPGWSWTALDELAKVARFAPPDARLALRTDVAECLGARDVRQIGQFGQGLAVSGIAWSPDGEILAIGQRAANVFSPSCSVTLLPLNAAGSQRTLSVPQNRVPQGSGFTVDYVHRIAFCPQGRHLALGMRSGWLHLFDLANPESKAQSQKAHEARVTGLVFAHDGASLYSCGANTVRRSATADLQSLATFTCEHPATALAVHPKERWLAVGSNVTHRLNGISLAPITAALPFNGPALAFTSDGLCLVGMVQFAAREIRSFHLLGNDWTWTASDRPTPRVNERIEDFDLHSSGDGIWVLFAALDAHETHAGLFDLASNRVVAEVAMDEPARVALAPGGRRFAVTASRLVRVYEMRGGQEQSYTACSDPRVFGFCLSPDGRTLITDSRQTSGAASRVAAWSLDDRSSPARVYHHAWPFAEPLRLTYATDRDELAHVKDDVDEAVQFWGPQSGLKRAFEKISHANALQYDRSGRLWAAAGDQVLVWDSDGQRVGAYQPLGGLATALTGRPGVSALATGLARTAAVCRNGAMLVLEQRSNSLHCHMTALISGTQLTSVALSDDEKLAVAASANGELIVVTLPQGAKQHVLQAHDAAIVAVRSSGNQLWASGDRNGLVKVWKWDGKALAELLTLRHPGPIRELQFHADGVQLFVLVENERAVRVHHLDRLRDQFQQLGLGDGLDVVEAEKMPARLESEVPATNLTEKPRDNRGLKVDVLASHFQPIRLQSHYVRETDKLWVVPAPPSVSGACRWTGWVRPPKAGRYTLVLKSPNSLAKLWLNGTVMIESRDADGFRSELELLERPYELQVDHWCEFPNSQLHLTWVVPGEKQEQPIDVDLLFNNIDDAAK